MGRKRDRSNSELLLSEYRERSDVLGELVRKREQLLHAVQTASWEEIFRASQRLPRDESWSDHLPVADPEKLSGQMTTVVERYMAEYRSDGDSVRRLQAYAQWCDHLHLCMRTSEALMKSSPELEQCTPFQVRKLCLALRRLDDTADEATMKEVGRKIAAMHIGYNSLTAKELAQQTCASTRMMLNKLEILVGVFWSPTLPDLISKVALASRMRADSLASLQTAMRMVQTRWERQMRMSDDDLIEHSVNVYANFLTIPTDDPIPASVLREQLEVFAAALDRLILQPGSGRSALEGASLVYIRQCVRTSMAGAPTLRLTDQ